VDRLTALEAEVDDLVERIALAMQALPTSGKSLKAAADQAIIACEARVDVLLAAIDQLIEPATVH
jgi:hypothetical protein